MKQKTINYLNSSAKKAEELLAQAVTYRSKFDSAKTTTSKEFYKKKLTKTVASLEKYMSLFKDIERFTNKPTVDADTPTEVEEKETV